MDNMQRAIPHWAEENPYEVLLDRYVVKVDDMIQYLSRPNNPHIYNVLDYEQVMVNCVHVLFHLATESQRWNRIYGDKK